MKPISLQGLCLLSLSLLQAAAVAEDPPTIATTISFCVDVTDRTRDKVLKTQDCTDAVQNGKQRLQIPALYNREFGPASLSYPTVTKAVITIHGGGSNPYGTYNGIHDSLKPAERDTVWVVGPQFLDWARGEPTTAGIVYWSRVPDKGYYTGHATVRPKGAQVSSMDLLDHLIRRMKAQAPNLAEVTVFGFSGGGRMVNQYSMATKIDDGSVDNEVPVSFRFMTSSAASYLYLNQDRYQSVSYWPPQYDPRPIPPDCAGYDDYPHGLSTRPAKHYVTRSSDTELIDRLKARKRLHLVGSADLEGGADGNCAVPLMGAQRVDRLFTYWHHLGETGARANALFCIVPGIAHSGNEMAASKPAMQFIRAGAINGEGCMPPSEWQSLLPAAASAR